MGSKPNNFRLIKIAQDEYDRLTGGSDSIKSNSVSELLSQADDGAFGALYDQLVESGMFYVTFRPKISDSAVALIHKTKNGYFTTKMRSSHMPRELRVMNVVHAWNQLSTKRDVAIAKTDWAIVVGYLDPGEMHRGPNSAISYSYLIPALMESGYDPLLPIRSDSVRTYVEEWMGTEIVKEINRWTIGVGSGLNPTINIRNMLTKVAKWVANYVKEYIAGGAKPALGGKTLANRRYRSNIFPGLYPHGIDEPLSETGFLELDVGYRVVGGNKSYFASEYSATHFFNTVERSTKEIKEIKDKPKWRDVGTVKTKVSQKRSTEKVSIKKIQDDLDKVSNVGRVETARMSKEYVNYIKENMMRGMEALRNFAMQDRSKYVSGKKILRHLLPPNMQEVYDSVLSAQILLRGMGQLDGR